jgi:hypothetical protein
MTKRERAISKIPKINDIIGKCKCGNNFIISFNSDPVGRISDYYQVICRKCMIRVVAISESGIICNTLHAIGKHELVKVKLRSLKEWNKK